MSSVQLDGTHTPTKRGGEAVAYQGLPISCSDAISGNHNDAYQLADTVDLMLENVAKSNIKTEGLFLNADAGFDTREFRSSCFRNDIIENIPNNKRNGDENGAIFDELLYEQRFVVERTNAWLDAFKALLIRFETNKTQWKALNLLAFTIILLRRL